MRASWRSCTVAVRQDPDHTPGFSQVRFGRSRGVSEGWVCVADTVPAIKYFSPTDDSRSLPVPITCYRVDKRVQGFSYSDWASWYKLAKLFDSFPP